MDQRFHCSQCGKCCRGWRLPVDAATVQSLQQRGQGQQLQHKAGLVLLRQIDESCVFLGPQQQCQLHSRWGAASKPRGCRLFPFRATATPDGVFVGVSFFCPSVQANEGQPLSHYQEQLEELTAQLPVLGQRGVEVWQHRSLSWDDYVRLEQFLTSGNLAGALWALCHWLKRQGSLEHCLALSHQALEPPRQPLVLLEEHFRAQLLAHCEVDAALRQSWAQDWVADRRLYLPRFQRWLQPSQVSLQADTGLLQRYLKALIFRKCLLGQRPLLANLAVLAQVPWLYSLWSSLSGQSSWALDQCELKLLTHANNLDSLAFEMAEALAQGV